MKRWINSIYTTQITWNQPNSTITHNHMKPTTRGKKKAQTYVRSPLVEIIGEAKLHGNGRSQWGNSLSGEKRRKSDRERQRGAE